MRLYFIRHGESEANLVNEFSNRNHSKHPLTEKGRQQAQALAEKLRDVKFAAIYASPLLRARQTAEILNAPHGLEIQITPAIREHDAGDLEGRSDRAAWDEYSKLFETWIVRRDLDARMPNGESFNEMVARFNQLVAGVVEKYARTDANILLVGHGGILHAMLPSLLANVDYDFGYKHLLGNAAVVIVEAKDNVLECISWDGVELATKREVVP